MGVLSHTHTHTHTILEEILKCKQELEKLWDLFSSTLFAQGGKQSTSEEKRFFSDQTVDKCIREEPNPHLLSLSSSFYFHRRALIWSGCLVVSVVSDSVWLHRRQPTRLPCPWDSPGKNTGVGCHFLLQCIKVRSESEIAQSCLTLSNPMDCSPPGSSVHGIFQARVLEWGAIAFSDLEWSTELKWGWKYKVAINYISFINK